MTALPDDPATAQQRRDKFEAIAILIWGHEWRGQASKCLGIHPRTINRWYEDESRSAPRTSVLLELLDIGRKNLSERLETLNKIHI
jgi:hypothetical protein